MSPYYERIAQLQTGQPTDAFEILCAVIFICAATALLVTAYSAIKAEIEYRKLTVKEFIMWVSGLAYVKKWLQNTFFLFTDNDWDKKQCEWLKERQGERGAMQVEDTWLKEKLEEEKKLLMESAKANMKTDKAIAKYECSECGYRDQAEMNLYAEISEAAKTFCYKQLCNECKNRKLKIVMIECKLFVKKGQ